MPQAHFSQEDWEKLEQLACLSNKFWKGRGNVTGLLKDVAQGKRTIIPTRKPLANASWAAEIMSRANECIQERQAFCLEYNDATLRRLTFEVQYAEIAFHEFQYYLECWTEDTEGNRDIEPLRHNWIALRPDRVINIQPLDAPWHEQGLDTIEVRFLLIGGWTRAYIPQPDEQVIEREEGVEVIRPITSTFWFIRSILPYGKDCIILSPTEVRTQVAEHFRAALANYQE